MLSPEHLRPAVALLWVLACAALLVPALAALFRRDGDPWKAVVFFCGLLFIAFPSRQMVRPADENARTALFVLSLLLAVTVIGLAWRELREWLERRR